MAFEYVSSINGAERNLETVLLFNSITVEVGDVVEVYTNGSATNGAAALPLFGFVHSFVDSTGNAITHGANTAGSQNSSSVDSVATAADNTTTGARLALVDTSVHSRYSSEVSGTLGTTASSNLRGARLDVDSANTDFGRLLETTATRTVGTPANFYSWGPDPKDTTRLIVSLAMSETHSVDE